MAALSAELANQMEVGDIQPTNLCITPKAAMVSRDVWKVERGEDSCSEVYQPSARQSHLVQ